jgi:TonB family protein
MKKLIVTLFSILFFILVFSGAADAQSNDSSSSTERQQKEKQSLDKAVKIKGKIPPSPGSYMMCFEDKSIKQLHVKIKVTFHSSGKVTAAEIDESSGCKFFDKETLRVARKIKFNPAIKNGEAVTVVKMVEYNYFEI